MSGHGWHTFLAPAKLNLFLHVVGQRADGYHLLQSVVRLLDYYDTLHLRVLPDQTIRRTKDMPGVAEAADLSIRAARLLQRHAVCPLGVEIRVEKKIPIGAGLGGGSSDAASVLLALNQLWQLHLPREELIALGERLGADVPVFLFGQNAWVEGIGEILQAIMLPPAWYAVLTPDFQVSTAQIFAAKELTRNTTPSRMASFFRGFGHNDLEPVVCNRHPALVEALRWLSRYGDARMTGSGSSIFVELDDEAQAHGVLAEKPAHWSGFVTRGIAQHPHCLPGF